MTSPAGGNSGPAAVGEGPAGLGLGAGLKLLAMVAISCGLGWGGYLLYQKYDVPIAVIGVDGELGRVAAPEVENIVAANLGGGFLSLDLEGICAALEAHPWVASASARRKWPDEVVIAIEEEVPIARWGEGRFLNNKGKILDIGNVELPETLPLLDGPEGMERRVMQQYRNFSQVLQPLGLKVEACQLAARGNWNLRFEPGLTLVIGKEPVAGKLQRFMQVWDKALKERMESVEQVDVRYGNGVAVRWKAPIEPAPETGGKS
jgi:cell division protein FtsQ